MRWRSWVTALYRASPTLSISSITRESLRPVLASCLADLPQGRVLDVGAKDAHYRRFIPQTGYTTLDIRPTGATDLCCDLHDISLKPDTFDTVIALEVLEHLYEPQRAVNEIHRVLRKGGVFVGTTRFICRYHPDPHDYYRFTSDGLKHLFAAFLPVRVVPHGNGLQAVWHIVNNDYRRLRVLLNIFNPWVARINFTSSGFPLGFVVRATK